jgi:hypothetical protein
MARSSPSPQFFMQQFYDWYVPLALKASAKPAWTLAMSEKGAIFDPDLARALKTDAEAQDKVVGEIVGLDFDPFLASQDPDRKYVVGSVARKGDRYWADVYGLSSGKMRARPDVIVELQEKDAKWIIVDFHYPGGGKDLLTTLKLLQRDRPKTSRPSR